MSAASGIDSPVRTASGRAIRTPRIWVTARTPSSGARRVVSPPRKSETPQPNAEPSPRTTTATEGGSTSGRVACWLSGRLAGSRLGRLLHPSGLGPIEVPRQCRRGGQDADLVGRLCITRRPPQGNDLEVAADLLEQRQRPLATLLVERDEWIVEHQRRG